MHQTNEDADLLVQTCKTPAANQDPIILGDDTDIPYIVLLAHHTKNVNSLVFFKPEAKKHFQKSARARCWIFPSRLAWESDSDNILGCEKSVE